MALLEVDHLTKHYPSFALQDITFALPAGYIMGYIGRNGAGKTTTLSAITRLIRPDGGRVSISGVTYEEDPAAYLDQIGYIGDASFFPSYLTPRDIRHILGQFYPTFSAEKYHALLKTWDLPERQKISHFSRGMTVKLMFAAVLSRDTRLLVLDEATNGLDPVVRREILHLLQDYIESGERSVIFSTHILADLEDIADYIFFLEGGQPLLFSAKDDLKDRYLLVKGGLSDLTEDLEGRLIGIERHAYGFEALFDTEQGGTPPTCLTADTPTIDQITVHLIQEGRH